MEPVQEVSELIYLMEGLIFSKILRQIKPWCCWTEYQNDKIFQGRVKEKQAWADPGKAQLKDVTLLWIIASSGLGAN